MMENNSESLSCGPSPAEIEISKWKSFIKKHEVCRMHVKPYKIVKHSDIDKLLHRTNVEKSIFYLTEGKIPKRPPKIRDKFGNELIYKNATKNLSKNQLLSETNKITADSLESHLQDKNELKFDQGISTVTKPRNKTTLYENSIRNRIFIPDKLESFKGITDVDEKYFSIVQRRYKRPKLSNQKYLEYLRESLRVRLQTGYVYDEIYKLREQSEIEKYKLDQLKLNLKQYKAGFDEFLAEDHNESMRPLLLYADEVAATEQMRVILRDKLLEISKVSCKIYALEDSWGNSKLCEEFLLSFFSILSGNSNTYYLNLKYGSDYGVSNLKQDNDESLVSLAQFTCPKIINNIDINLQNPSYMLEIFNSLNHQCLDYLTFIELIDQPNKTISAHLDAITKICDGEIRFYKQDIARVTNLINFMEQNNEALKAHSHELLNGSFKETFDGAEECIVINEYVKQVYNKCIVSIDTYMKTEQMMNALALAYKNILLEMDNIPGSLLKDVVKVVQNRENKRLTTAYDARRRLNEFQVLTDQMSRIFNPVTTGKNRKLMCRSLPKTKKRVKHIPVKEISKEDKQYLHFFTKFCEYTDDPEEYLSKRECF